MRIWFSSWVSVVVVLAACSSGESHFLEERKEASTEQIRSYCDEFVDWQVRCGEVEAEVREEHVETCDAFPGWTRVWSEWIVASAECFESLGCDESDDMCASPRVVGITDEDLEEDALLQRCLERERECGGGWSDGICYGIATYHDEARQEAELCLDTESMCEPVEMCLEEF